MSRIFNWNNLIDRASVVHEAAKAFHVEIEGLRDFEGAVLGPDLEEDLRDNINYVTEAVSNLRAVAEILLGGSDRGK